MQRVVITVQKEGQDESFDLDVPADLSTNKLAQYIGLALNWDNHKTHYYDFQLRPDRASIVLAPQHSLSDANLWDGTKLILSRQRSGRLKGSREISAWLQTPVGKQYPLNPNMTLRVGRATSQTSAAEMQRLIDLSGESGSKTVSRKHADLQFMGGQWRLHTSDAIREKTRLNGEQLPGDVVPLNNGDVLQFGRVEVTFCVETDKPTADS